MPWCDDCDRYLAPSTVTHDGACPTCGRPVDVGDVAKAAGEEEPLPPVPWHLKLLAVAVAIYLTYRLIQAIGWIAG
jgi:hypothetical protein